MAKKSSKTRRARAKQDAAKKKAPTKVVKTAAITAEGSDEPVVKATKETPAKEKTTTTKKKATEPREKPLQSAVEAKVEKAEQEPALEMLQPTRNRMLVSAFALVVIVVGLLIGANVVHQRATNKNGEAMIQSGQDSGKADEILQSGGNVCTNGTSQTDTTGSSNPDSVGMVLQSNPVSTIQTPETLSSGSDANTLQGASCF